MLKRFFKFFSVIILLCMLPVVNARANEISQEYIEASYNQDFARDMLELVNEFRTGDETWYWNSTDTQKIYVSSLKPLTWDYGLEKVAMQRAVELAFQLSHDRPSGESCFTAYGEISSTLGNLASKGENIAWGYYGPRGAFDGWKEDTDNYIGQGHRRNMLDPKFTHIGIACAIVRSKLYWVMELGSGSSGVGAFTTDYSEVIVPVKVLWEDDDIYINGQSLEMDGDTTGTANVYVDGTSVTLWVAAWGKGISYQWQVSKDHGKTWSSCTGTGSKTFRYTFTLKESSHKYQYRCLVSNASGSVASKLATFTCGKYMYGPNIIESPKNTTGIDQKKVTFSVKSESLSPQSYQWQYSKDYFTWTNCSTNANSADYTFTAEAKMDGWIFRCIVSNEDGKLTTYAARLTVIIPPSIQKQPGSVEITEGETASFYVTASGTDVQYQWQYSKDKGRTWLSCGTTANKSSYSTTATEAKNGWYYRCVVTNSGGTATSEKAVLIVGLLPVIITQPQSVTALAGEEVTFQIEAVGDNLEYMWVYAFEFLSGYGIWIPSEDSPTFTLRVTSDLDNRLVGCVVSNEYGEVESDFVKLNVAKSIDELVCSVFTLPRSLTTIDAEALKNISTQKIIIPKTVKTIESGAFANCRGLRILVFEGNPQTIASDILQGCGTVTIQCPRDGSAEKWAKENGYIVQYG